MQKVNIILLGLILSIAFGCMNTSNDEDEIRCEVSVFLGELQISDSSITDGFKSYDPFNIITFENGLGDTLIFNVDKFDSTNVYDRNIDFPCELDTTKEIRGNYLLNSEFLRIIRYDSSEVSRVRSISLRVWPILYTENPRELLYGDFLNFSVLTIIENGTSLKGIMRIPLDLKTYPTPFEELDGFNYNGEFEVGGEIYEEVYSSTFEGENDTKIWFTIDDGIILFEDPDEIEWFLIGKK